MRIACRKPLGCFQYASASMGQVWLYSMLSTRSAPAGILKAAANGSRTLRFVPSKIGGKALIGKVLHHLTMKTRAKKTRSEERAESISLME